MKGKRGQDSLDRLKTEHIDTTLGLRLRRVREAMSLSRREVAAALDVSETRIKNYEDGLRIPASRLWQFCGRYGLEVTRLFADLPHHVGPPPETPCVAGVAEESAAFDHEADDILKAIAVAAADLDPAERALALAALRGMGVRKLRRP